MTNLADHLTVIRQRLRTIRQALAQEGPVALACPSCGVAVHADMKSFEPSAMGNKKTAVQQTAIIQMDSARQVLTAVIQSPNLPHLVQVSGEMISLTYDTDAVREMAWDYLREGRQRSIGICHDEVTQSGIVDPDGAHAVMVESFVAQTCFEVKRHHVPSGSWVASFQFSDDEAWDRVLSGELRAPSLTAALSDVEIEVV